MIIVVDKDVCILIPDTCGYVPMQQREIQKADGIKVANQLTLREGAGP